MITSRIAAACVLLLAIHVQTANCQNKIWGMTSGGGAHGFGVIFTTNADGSNYQVVYHFDSVNGALPESKLLKAGNGKLYGTTVAGGAHNDGVLFEIDQNGKYRKKVDFHDPTTGSRLQGGLAMGYNGKLYGAAFSGGENYDGTVFEYDIERDKLNKLSNLNNEGQTMGAYPFGSLVLAYNGKFYGTCYAGGKYTLGVIFELDPVTGIVNKKFDFDAVSGGRAAFNMTLGSDGKLYGTTGSGGAFGQGTIFAFDPDTGHCEKIHDFDGAETGAIPIAPLTLAYNGKMYGSASWGGKYNNGVLFEFDYHRRTVVKRLDFDEINTGKAPRAGLLQSPNGKLYGTTEQGGTHAQGVMFEFDPGSGSFSKKRDFSMPTGGQPQSCEMFYFSNQDRALQSIAFDEMQTLNIQEYYVPLPATASSGLPITYFSSDSSIISILENKLAIKKVGSVTITASQPGNSSFLPAADVTRAVKVDSVAKVNTVTSIGKDPESSFDISVRENPFTSTLRFQINSSKYSSANVILYTMLGQRVHERRVQTNMEVEFDVTTPGMYLIGVQTSQGRKVVKVQSTR